jgi:hypothetical protein
VSTFCRADDPNTMQTPEVEAMLPLREAAHPMQMKETP